MLGVESVRSGKCEEWKVLGVESVRRGSVRSGKC